MSTLNNNGRGETTPNNNQHSIIVIPFTKNVEKPFEKVNSFKVSYIYFEHPLIFFFDYTFIFLIYRRLMEPH